MLNKKALAASVSAPPAIYPEDVFSTYLYTGNSSTQTITNGIDLATKGGLVWRKSRTQPSSTGFFHNLTDTARGTSQVLYSNATDAQTDTYQALSSYNTDGFTMLGGTASANQSGDTYCSWTFREQAKFFDIVTFSGNSSTQNISHNLGSVPGMIIIKRTDSTGDWWVYHRSLGNTGYMRLNLTNASATSAGIWDSTTPTSSVFSLGNGSANLSGGTYIAYLFAHDAGGFGTAGTDNVISCGSFTTDGSGNATVNLGYEPQYLMFKSSSSVDSWYVVDVMRGWSQTQGNTLKPNTTNVESNDWGGIFIPTATGFSVAASFASTTYIYMAIRRPMKVPTTGASVFSPIISSASINTKLTTGFPVDSQWGALRGGDSDNFQVIDRLRKISTNSTENNGSYLRTSVTNAESTVTTSRSNFWDNTGFRMFSSWEGGNTVFYNFRRAPGFFDQVCYTGTGSARTLAHNLTVAPELMIVKPRSITGNWQVYHSATGADYATQLNLTSAVSISGVWDGGTPPTATVFSVSGASTVNGSGSTYVAYLFATCPGVSKVGSYTGNGSSQTINCGFTSGARFVMIKRTDSTGNWCVFDTARGIVSGNDPQLRLNDALSGVGEINEDALDPANSGFIVNETTESLNASGGTYIYLAIS